MPSAGFRKWGAKPSAKGLVRTRCTDARCVPHVQSIPHTRSLVSRTPNIHFLIAHSMLKNQGEDLEYFIMWKWYTEGGISDQLKAFSYSLCPSSGVLNICKTKNFLWWFRKEACMQKRGSLGNEANQLIVEQSKYSFPGLHPMVWERDKESILSVCSDHLLMKNWPGPSQSELAPPHPEWWWTQAVRKELKTLSSSRQSAVVLSSDPCNIERAWSCRFNFRLQDPSGLVSIQPCCSIHLSSC